MPVAGVDEGDEEVRQVSRRLHRQLCLALEQEDLQQVDGLGHPLAVVYRTGCAEARLFIGGSPKKMW